MNVFIIGNMSNIDAIKENFFLSGFTVLQADQVENCLEQISSEKPDLVIMDIGELNKNCISQIREMRQESDTPILLLAPSVDDVFKLISLELGINDYITKPVSPRELVVRSRALLRRLNGSYLYEREIYRFDDFILNATAHQCLVSGKVIDLTPVEYDLLYFLVRSKNSTCTRSQLMEAAHTGREAGIERTIDAHIHNLRKKLEPDPLSPRYIRTVFGAGYCFSTEKRIPLR